MTPNPLTKRICLIVPYFGTFSNYFQLFLNSCGHNPEIDWLIITDNNDPYEWPANVHKIEDSFANVKKRIQSLFDFDISLDTPHKSCEFKPAYGFIFRDLIQDYDFWGYCDIDVIYGKISGYINDELLDRYNKLFTLGHFTLIKNAEEFNLMFKRPIRGRLLYQEAFSSPENFNFDEEFLGKLNINTLFADAGYDIYRCPEAIADIYTKSGDFRLTGQSSDNKSIIVESKKNALFVYDNGELLRYEKVGDRLECKKYMYIHLQKRKMKDRAEKSNKYTIIPNEFKAINSEISLNTYRHIPKKRFNNQYFRIRFSNLVTKLKQTFK